LFGTSVKNWVRLCSDHGGVDWVFLPRALFITVVSFLLFPIRLFCTLMYRKKILQTRLIQPPIFIIGHWRSGTTFLHELLSSDPQFASVSLWHTLVPETFLGLEPVKKTMAWFLPRTRPMDAVEVDIDSPYEEEAGLAALSGLSFFHCFYFPRDAKRQFSKSVLFEGVTTEEKQRWKERYTWFLKAVTYSKKGQRLVVKNPANTARIMILLELFPSACFIHIYRNPYEVYASTIHMYQRVLHRFALQQISVDEIEQFIVQNYVSMMKQFFIQKDSIPNGHFVEICYEDFIADPLSQMKKIYAELGLSGFEDAKSGMEQYLAQQAKYVPNRHRVDEEKVQRVNMMWRFTVERWNYQPPTR